MKKKQAKLQGQIFGVAGLIATLVILLLGFITSISLYSLGLNGANAVIRNKNQAMATLILGYFSPLRRAVEFAAGPDSGIDHGSFNDPETEERILNLYEVLQQTIPNINYIYSGYEDGTLLINNYTPPEGYDPVVRPWYQAALRAAPEISGGIPYQEINTKEWLVSISRVVKDRQNETAGVLAVDAGMDTVVTALSARDEAYPTVYSYVIDGGGTILIHRREDLRGEMAEEVFQALPDDGSLAGNFEYRFEKVSRLAHFTRLEHLDWIVITAVKRTDILRPVFREMALSSGLVVLITLITIWFVSYLLSRHIISPLTELHRHVQAVVNGRADPSPLDNVPGNEIGTIARAIEELTQEALYRKNLELRRKNDLLETISNTDQLTGIANRRRTNEVLEQEIDRAGRYNKPFCLLLFDLDWFKQVNDAHGHDAGDAVLKEVAEVVQSVIRRTDTLGRWGGEEFMIICPEAGLETGKVVAEKVREAVKAHTFPQDLHITISMGVTGYTEGMAPREMLLDVDRKMYLAKQQGRDRVVV